MTSRFNCKLGYLAIRLEPPVFLWAHYAALLLRYHAGQPPIKKTQSNKTWLQIQTRAHIYVYTHIYIYCYLYTHTVFISYKYIFVTSGEVMYHEPHTHTQVSHLKKVLSLQSAAPCHFLMSCHCNARFKAYLRAHAFI